MTKIQDILTPNHILLDCHISSKKRTLELLGKLIAEQLPNIDYKDILTGFLAREKLGSTIITEGVAVPHTRLAEIERPIGAFIRLFEPITYDNHDEKVDMLFGLAMPAEDQQQHVSVLGCLAGCFKEQESLDCLRKAKTADEVFACMTGYNAEMELK